MEFIRFPEQLYKDCPNWVPALHYDELSTLGGGNPSLEYCERACFMVYDGSRPVGRVAAIINHNANRRWNQNTVRFGWIDFIDDVEVARLLVEAVTEWGRERGCTLIKGPLGFTDMDKEGLLVEGFEHPAPFTVIYNYPYYGPVLEKLGFRKDADWTQKMMDIPQSIPKIYKAAALAESHFGLHALKCRSTRELGKKYGRRLFEVCNEAFSSLYEFSPLSRKQIDQYVNIYIPLTSKDFISVVLDRDDNIAGFAFCVPSISKAMKKAGGRLLPFGFIHLLKAMHKNDTIEALMIGVLPEYQGTGASALLCREIHRSCLKYGIRRMLSNPQLEDNVKVQTMFSDSLEAREFMRRRSYVKEI